MEPKKNVYDVWVELAEYAGAGVFGNSLYSLVYRLLTSGRLTDVKNLLEGIEVSKLNDEYALVAVLGAAALCAQGVVDYDLLYDRVKARMSVIAPHELPVLETHFKQN